MSFFYHELKNHINRDALSDWFNIIHHKYGSFKKDRPNIFYKEIKQQILETTKKGEIFESLIEYVQDGIGVVPHFWVPTIGHFRQNGCPPENHPVLPLA